MNSTISMGNSRLISKNNSPLKFSVRNSQLFLQEREAAKNHLKSYKFYYQIGFGGFGRVWKVASKESLKDWAMKEISKRKYSPSYLE